MLVVRVICWCRDGVVKVVWSVGSYGVSWVGWSSGVGNGVVLEREWNWEIESGYWSYGCCSDVF